MNFEGFVMMLRVTGCQVEVEELRGIKRLKIMENFMIRDVGIMESKYTLDCYEKTGRVAVQGSSTFEDFESLEEAHKYIFDLIELGELIVGTKIV